MSSFCSYPESVMVFMFVAIASFGLMFAALLFSFWLFATLPLLWVLYLWFGEGIPWGGRYYGYQQMPGGGLVYSGEEYDCRCCKHIQDQLDCKYGCLTTPEKFAHRNDWRQRYPCSLCWRSGASFDQDLYKGPVKWAQGERP